MMAAASAPSTTLTCLIHARVIRQALRVASTTTASPLRLVGGLQADGRSVMLHSQAESLGGFRRFEGIFETSGNTSSAT